MSRLLLENSNNIVEPALKEVPSLEQNQNRSFIEQETLTKGRDIQEQASKIIGLRDTNVLTRKMLFKKIAKGIDKKDFVIAKHKRRIQELEAKIEQLEPRKRRKVKTSPNSKFARIDAIKRAQIEARDREIKEKDMALSDDSAFIIDYIEVKE